MSIRRRMTLSLIAAMLVLLGTAGAVLFAYMRSEIGRQFDDVLMTKAKALQSVLRQNKSGKVDFDFSDDAMPEFNRSRRAEYFQLLSADGKSIERSDSLGSKDLAVERRNLDRWFEDFELPDGRPGRAVALRVLAAKDGGDEHGPKSDDEESGVNAGGPAFLLIVARERGTLDHTLATMGWGVGGTVVFLAFAVGALMPWLVGRNLRPLETMAAQAGEIDAHSLKRRFPVGAMPEELQPICTRLNDLLDRLQGAFERERRFSADVAHELRTPIAELRLLSEVALKFSGDVESTSRSFEDSLDIAKQMEMIVGTLLEMIGSDGAIPAEQLESVDIAAMVQEAWRSLALQAAAKQIQWKSTGLETASVQANGLIVRRIFLNLLGNAVEYAPPESAIDCSCELGGEAMVVRISNAAPTLAQSDLVHMTEPFWRKDPSRTGNRHSGLGLSLVSCYVQRLGAAMDFAISQEGRFTVTLRFPQQAQELPSGPNTRMQ